jgi:hypothetical protein
MTTDVASGAKACDATRKVAIFGRICCAIRQARACVIAGLLIGIARRDDWSGGRRARRRRRGWRRRVGGKRRQRRRKRGRWRDCAVLWVWVELRRRDAVKRCLLFKQLGTRFGGGGWTLLGHRWHVAERGKLATPLKIVLCGLRTSRLVGASESRAAVARCKRPASLFDERGTLCPERLLVLF